MDETFHTAQVYENAKFSHIRHFTGQVLSGLDGIKEFRSFACLGTRGTLRKDQAAFFRHAFDDLQAQGAANISGEIVFAAIFVSLGWQIHQMRAGNKSIQALPFDQQSTPIETCDMH